MNNIEKTLLVLGTTAVLSGCFGGEYADDQPPAGEVPGEEQPGGEEPGGEEPGESGDITLDFKGDTKTYLTPGDSNGDTSVAAGPLDATNEALKVVVTSGYDSGVALPITIPTGKTLADYTEVSFKVYYTAEGSADTDFKRIQVIASSGDLPETVPLIKYDGTWADNATTGHLGVMENGKEDKLESTAFQEYSFDLTDGNVADLLPDVANSLDAAAKALTGDINLIVGFSHSDSTYYIDDVVLVAAESEEAPEAKPDPLVLNFETQTIGDPLLSSGWNPEEATAVVADDPITSGNNVMSVTSTNYNTAAVVSYDLPAGTTLADYSTITYKAYYASGDVGYKLHKVFAFDTAPATGILYDEAGEIGSYDRALGESEAWEDMSIDITNTSTLAGTVYLSIGSNNSGAVVYYDDITLVLAK